VTQDVTDDERRRRLAGVGGFGAPRAVLARVERVRLFDGVRFSEVDVVLRVGREGRIKRVKPRQARPREGFDVDEAVARALDRGDELVELEVHGERVLVLRALDEEHHEEGHDRRPRVDDELPVSE